MEATTNADTQARYLALCSRDARFDGRFFTGVTSTGIYCRPVCSVRTPKRENCRFFDHAAQAERAGFRPCLRCRPELAPMDRAWSAQDAGDILMGQATRLLDDPQRWHLSSETGPSVVDLAARLGVSDRHLRRLFESRLGVSPLQYLQTRKLLAAKQLLADTALPVAEVAQASGFGSVRRFNAAFVSHYGLNPTELRRSVPTQGLGSAVRLGWRPPLDAHALLSFLATRQMPGVEHVDVEGLTWARTVRLETAGRVHAGWMSATLEPDHHRLLLRTSESLHTVLPALIWRVRALFDLDADPQAINAVLHINFPGGDGLRVPGCFDGFELAVRAVLGQQITVAAARTLATRLLERFGEPLVTDRAELHRLFPTAAVLADAAPETLGELGIVRQRQAAIQALARAVASGTLDLSPHADLTSTTKALIALPGIGAWTAQYIAMRALRWPDAWPSGDVALIKALGITGKGRAAQAEAERIATAWQPWRSYAVIRTWAGHHRPRFTETTP